MSGDIDTVLFDIDGTICEYRRSTEHLLEVAFGRTGVDPFFTADEYVSRFGAFLDDSDDMESLRENVFASIASDRGRDPALGRELARAYASARDHSNVRFRDGVPTVLDLLENKYTLGAVTNGAPSMQSTKLDALGVDCFETVVYAGYETPAKPDPEPFRAALEDLDTSPTRTVYVGNSLDSDVAGGKAAGLYTALVGDSTISSSSPEPDVVLDTLGELPRKLPTLSRTG